MIKYNILCQRGDNVEPINMKNGESFLYSHFVHEAPRKNLFSMHSHNIYEIIHVIEGDISYVIEDRKYKVNAGDMIISRPSDYHCIEINSPANYDRQSILFDGKELGIDMSILPKRLDVVRIHEGSITDGIFKKLDHYAHSFSQNEFFDLLKILTKELVYNLSLSSPYTDTDAISTSSPVLTAALKYIKEHLFEIKDVKEIAQAVFVTESYLFRLFKAHLYQSPKKYIRDKRMLKAQRMLWEGKRPTEVSAICGFVDYATFYRNYIDFFGASPSDKNFDFRLTKTVD